MDTSGTLTYEPVAQILYCQGDWTLDNYQALSQQLQQLNLTDSRLTIDGSRLNHLDSTGALLLQQLPLSKKTAWQNFSAQQTSLIKLIVTQAKQLKQPESAEKLNVLAQIGCNAEAAFANSIKFLAFLGELLTTIIQTVLSPARLRWREVAGILETGGATAIPIIGLLSFLIGVVLAYQMGVQLQTYGANIFIVNFLGLAIFREFGPLLTAIIVAGRTGSAFTAQIGMMQVNEEIDALRTLGISPTELLVLPRMLGLAIALPLLTVLADIFGIFGGMLMARGMLGLNFYDFLQRFQDAIQLKTFVIGMIKTPVFAMVIASIGCYQGLQVSGSAESVGRLTTKSVVQAIFFIIVADAAFSILFSWLNI